MARRPYLNVGAGGSHSPEWENIDLYSGDHVRRHDIRKPFPYRDGTFEVVYASHVLEHLTPADAAALLREAHRVLGPGGIVRIAVPDLERLAREYLAQLEAAAGGDEAALRRYRWIQVELLDQMVRTRPGGAMGELLAADDLDREYVESRVGAELVDEVRTHDSAPAGGRVAALRSIPPREIGPRVAGELKRRFLPPQATGEAHKWMYDRLSLRLALEAGGFGDFAVRAFDESAIPDWDRYALDAEPGGARPRKPDSIYVEAVRP